MPNATGAFTRLAMKKASAWGVLATGNYLLTPAKNIDLEAREPFLDDAIIGLGREQRRQARDAKVTTGRLQVPLDSRYIGHWLTGLLGLPVTTGAGPFTHVFKSSVSTLGVYSAEKQFTNLTTPLYSLVTSMMINGLSFRAAATGLADIDIDVLFDDSVDGTGSNAGTPTELVYSRFYQFDCALKKDGADIAKVTSLELNYRNNLDPIRYIGGVGAIGDIEMGLATIGGTIEARFADNVLGALAAAKSVFDMQLIYTKSASEKLTIELEQAELTRNGRAISGPGGISQSFLVVGSKDLVEGQMVTATLINDVASYA